MGNKGQLLMSQYIGSKSLSFLCTLTSLPIDQINFIACQFAALLLSFILKNKVKNPKSRLIYCMVSGVFICNFCFGVQTLHIVASAGLSCFLIHKVRSPHMPWCVFVISMIYLSWVHIMRQFFGMAEGYSLDITGPLMVLTQKVTSLAFAVNDGRKLKAEKKITELQKNHCIDDIPNMLEFWSFIFQFQSILAGPLVFFTEYRDFIYNNQAPNSFSMAMKKLSFSVLFALMYIKIAPKFQVEYLRDEDFLQNTSMWYKLLYLHVATSMERTKYYHAWILSDAVCNASGLGYNKETKSWDMVENVNAWNFETALNLKETLDHWNKGTMRWLRYIVYERANPKMRTLAVYATSAFWHGFYPGYYLTFFSGALFTSAARSVRKAVRPFFMDNPVARWTYHFVTWFTTRVVISYVSFTFVLLDLMPSIHVYMRLSFFMHIAAVGALIALPKVAKRFGKAAATKASTNNNSSKVNGSVIILNGEVHNNGKALNGYSKSKTG